MKVLPALQSQLAAQAAAADPARADVAHLLRRTGFGARAADIDRAAQAGYAATVDQLLAGLRASTPAADKVAVPDTSLVEYDGQKMDVTARRKAQQQARDQDIALLDWWLGRMVGTEQPFAERLTFFWHGHFATAVQKVKQSHWMYTQQQLFRTLGTGRFVDLVQAVAKDPAMQIWLDTNKNKKAHANENFARELMELFTLGVGNYSEDDVKEAARAFTGWTFNRTTGAFSVQAGQHDAGPKTVLGQSGNLGGEDVVRIVTAHPASARFLATRLWSRFAAPVAGDDPVVADLAAQYAATGRTDTLIKAMLLHPRFRAPDVRTGLVKAPVEWVVGALRSMGVAVAGNAKVTALARATLVDMGQVPFNPPNVGGWPSNGAWLTTATALSRLRFAQGVVQAADLGAVASAAPADRPAAAARLLGADPWSDRTSAALTKVAGDPKALVTLDLVSPDYTLA